MSTVALQPTQVFNRPFPITDRKFQHKERKLPNHEEIPTDREERLQSIAFWTRYMEDLKAGRPVENVSPSNDPYFLVPENIAGIIEGEKDILEGRYTTVDTNNIWASLGIE